MTTVAERRFVREIYRLVAGPLDGVGLMCRVFARMKTDASIEEKIARKGYSIGGRYMQDLVGIRVASYFVDDLAIVRSLLEQQFGEPVDEVKDAHGDSIFQPVRWNLVFALPEDLADECKHVIGSRPIDTTFEVQLRTVLAEGWHEVEHDLRYKRPEDWSREPEMSRTLNGLLASLENADWTMLQLFERLAHQKYKRRDWESMLRMRLRLRLPGSLAPPVAAALADDVSLAKRLLRTPRRALILQLAEIGEQVPLTLTNVVLAANRLVAHSNSLIALEPPPLQPAFAGIGEADAQEE